MPKAPKYWLVGIIFLFFLMGSSVLAQSEEGVIFWVPVKDVPNLGMVDWGLASFVQRALREAEEAGAQAVVLEIDTSGGLVDAMLFIKDAIISSSCPTVAFINHRAWSAGTFIALACETIVFAPDATMGAAEPRSGAAGEVEQPDPKTVSAIRAQIEALAEARGRDPLLFASMVDRNLEINGLVKKGELLTLRASQALEYGAGDLIATNREELLNKLGLEGTVRELSPSWSENLARLVTNPVVVPVLLILALGGILLEVLTPGFGVPGIVGLISFSLFFGGRYLAGLSGWEPLIFFLVGVILLIVELFLPGFGITGISGMGMLALSIYLVLRETSILFWQEALYQLFFYIALMGGVFLVLLAFLPQSPVWQRLGLRKEITGRAYETEEKGWEPSLVGKTGIAKSMLRPAGIVEIEGKRWDAITEGEFISPGTRVKVEKVKGNTIVVKSEEGG